MKPYRLPILAILIAVAITTTMDFNGYIALSALPLLLITLVFWGIGKLSKKEMGLTWGKGATYRLAVAYPIIVLGSLALLALFTGALSLMEADWSKTFRNIGLGVSIGTLMTLLTEEGFFRGYLWGAFAKSGLSPFKTLLWTSLVFTIWHISAVTSGTDYGLPLWQVPIYLVNATLLGLIWGMLRLISGSILAASLCHAIWNALAYELFGFGEKVGALGIQNTLIFGPEVGLLGIFFNGMFFLWLWRKHKHLLDSSN